VCAVALFYIVCPPVIAHQLSYSNPCATPDCSTHASEANNPSTSLSHGKQLAELTADESDIEEPILKNAQRALELLERTENILIQDCMQAQGFEFFGPTDATLINEVTPSLEQLTPNQALETGYEVYTSSTLREIETLAEEEAGYLNSLTPADRERYVETLMGGEDSEHIEIETSDGSVFSTESGGCMRDAMESLFGTNITDVMGLFYELQQVANTERSKHADVVEAEKRWSLCMSASGYVDFQEPSDAVGSGISKRSEHGSLSGEEKNIAIADAYCRLESEIAEATYKAEVIEDAEFRASNSVLISKWTDYEQQMIANAKDIRVDYGFTDGNLSLPVSFPVTVYLDWCICEPARHSAMHFTTSSQLCC